MQRNQALLLFNMYSYLTSLWHGVMELLPHPLRVLMWRMLFKRLGRFPFIDHRCYFRYPHRIVIGDRVAFNRGCQLYASMRAAEGTITIGNDVVFSPGVCIYAASHDYNHPDFVDTAKPVVIGDGAWIAANTIILPGVTVGRGAVVGAGSVVSRSVPDYAVVAGNPARVIKQRDVHAS